MNIALRRYGSSDALGTWDVYRAAVRVTAAKDYTVEQVSAWAPDDIDLGAWSVRRASAHTLVAEEAGRILGFGDLTDDGLLDMLFVHPDAANRGVARLLVTEVVNIARNLGITTITTHASRTARPAFERFGFVVDCENTGNMTRGVVVPNFDMHLDLSESAS